jgi:hypothetical protein
MGEFVSGSYLTDGIYIFAQLSLYIFIFKKKKYVADISVMLKEITKAEENPFCGHFSLI